MQSQPIILDPALTTLDDPTPYIESGIVCIPLLHGLVALVDEADYHLVAGFHWTAHRDNYVWYVQSGIYRDGRRYTVHMHKLIIPGFPGIDHKDKNGLNNRRNNLRPADQASNMYNSRKQPGTSSQFKGVSFRSRKGITRKPWEAHIGYKGVLKHLGRFYTEEDAAHAYDAAARELAGEFASLNFPDDLVWVPRPNEPARTCLKGHEYTPENTVKTKDGRRCRTCRNASGRRGGANFRARQKAKLLS